MPVGVKPERNLADEALGYVVGKLRGLGIGGEGSPAGKVGKAIGGDELVSGFVGPENPPVNLGLRFAEKVQNSGPMVGLPAMVASHGGPNVWAAEPGKPLGQFRRAFKHTGEGSAYKGAGGYIAQEPKVTPTYREQAPVEFSVGGKPVEGLGYSVGPLSPMSAATLAEEDSMKWVIQRLRQRFNDPVTGDNLGDAMLHPKMIAANLEREKNMLRASLDDLSGGKTGDGHPFFFNKWEAEAANEHLRRMEAIDEALRQGVTARRGGAYYTLDYPDELLPSTMRFEDSLRDQPPLVRKALADLPGELADAHYAKKAEGLSQMQWEDITPTQRQEVIDRWRSDPRYFNTKNEPLLLHMDRWQPGDIHNMSGEKFYDALSHMMGHDDYASQILRGAGIPGHNFYDNFSRKRLMQGGMDAFTRNGDLLPDLTKNFVVYDPDNTLHTLGRHNTLEEMVNFQRELVAKNPRMGMTNPIFGATYGR